MSNVFRTNFNHPVSLAEPKCPTERVELIYNSATNKIEKNGVSPFYERIQSYYESTRLDRKIEQFKRGNSLALGVPGGTYGDFCDVPNNLAQVLQARDTGRAEFDKLSPEIRKIFGDSYDEFASCLQDGSYQQRLVDFANAAIKAANNSGSGQDPSGDPKS